MDWGAVWLGLLVPILLAGVGVGFAEETCSGASSCGHCVPAATARRSGCSHRRCGSGLFHFTNILNGQSVGVTVGLLQYAILVAVVVAAVVIWRNDTAPGTTPATADT